MVGYSSKLVSTIIANGHNYILKIFKDKPMSRLTTLPIRSLLLLITFVVALPAAGIIIYSGIQFRNVMLDDARKETLKLVDSIANEQQHLVAGAEQLMTALAQLPEVKGHDAARVEPILRKLLKLNPMYSNILVADLDGSVWATAVPVNPPFFVGDRRYFRNALANGQLSSGEYVVSRSVIKPVFNLAYPLKDDHGANIGVISVGFAVDRYQHLLERMRSQSGTNFSFIDHQGIILSRAIEQEQYIGKSYKAEEFKKMKEGPESGTSIKTGITGDRRIISYRKLQLAGEQAPYMYVTAGVPVAVAVHDANRSLAKNVSLLALLLALACGGAVLIGKYAIVDRFKVLEDASQRLAAGDFQVRVSDLIVGGELGSLGKTFDTMAQELAIRESERLKAEEERLEAVEERLNLERQLLHTQKLESLGVLAGGIAHDFNNILTSIVGNADLALMRINKESPCVDNLHKIEEAAARAADLAKQMLAYSGKGKFVVEHINLNRLLEDMMHMLEVSISKKAVLQLNLIPDLPSVEVDATQIRQIVMNLVINASEAIGDRSGFIAISTGCMDCDQGYLKDVWLEDNITDGLYVYLEIADTGCGMDRETVTKIFDPFFTTKFTGRGLGMAAVLGIVRGHKGAIKVYSELNKGSSFKILLPTSVKPVELFNHVNEQGDWHGSGTVLLVDDEETVRGIGKEMLHELGFTTITASDGRKALEIFKSIPDIAFVILDLTMPHMDGEQCFRELKLLNPDIKVIMSSGFSEHEVTRKFAGKGLAGFIQKPYTFSVLKAAIKSLKLPA